MKKMIALLASALLIASPVAFAANTNTNDNAANSATQAESGDIVLQQLAENDTTAQEVAPANNDEQQPQAQAPHKKNHKMHSAHNNNKKPKQKDVA